MTRTAIILAGGFGTRLQSVVSNLPKPMAPVNGQPFLNYQLRYLAAYGIQNVILSVGHLHEKISGHYDNAFEGLALDYVVETEPLGTGGGIRLAMQQCEDDTALVLNGDSFFKIDLGLFGQLHAQNNSLVSLALRQVSNASRYGTIALNAEGRIVSFKEKSGLEEPGTINAGVYLLDKNTYLSNTPAGSSFSIEKDFFEKQVNALTLKGFEFEGYFIDIGIPEDYNKAQHDFKES